MYSIEQHATVNSITLETMLHIYKQVLILSYVTKLIPKALSQKVLQVRIKRGSRLNTDGVFIMNNSPIQSRPRHHPGLDNYDGGSTKKK